MRKALPLNGLRAFEATARHMSFQKAADELCVTSTAISHQIRQLEEFLGIALFKRRPRPITLTDSGADLFPAVRSALDALDDAVKSIQPRPNRERLTVSMTNSFATHWLLPRLSRFHEQHPDIAINVHASESIADLETGEVDCAIRYVGELPQDLVCYPLFRDNFFPVCTPSVIDEDLPLTNLQELCQKHLLHFEWKRRGRNNPTWDRWFDCIGKQFTIPTGCRSEEGVQFSEETLAIQAAIQGQGVALCSTLMTAYFIKNNQLAVAFDFSIPGYLSALVYPPSARKRESIGLFREWIIAEARAFRSEHPTEFFTEDEWPYSS